ncbi:MAG: DUF2339 domain-containing protein [Alphaproteobacteria bacterium]|nr:MAG: DUF2339 domain-containing protein [Alphaproteobacteria bacterium]
MELLVLLLSVAVFVLFLQLNGLKTRIRALENAGEAGLIVEPALAAVAEEIEAARLYGVAGSTEAESVAEAEPESEPEPARDEGLGGLFERWVAGRLLIWIGGAALFVAGILLIRYSIEVGLVTPAARMIGAAVFGLLLVALSEYARASRFADEPRIAQVLAGAGLAILYATPYAAYVLYQLIGTGTASAAMVAVTVAALVMSLRHGAPTAIMGLIGGFLTPALVGDSNEGALPLLAYLALLDIALFAIAWRRGWTWLAATAVLLSFLWTGFLLVRPAEDALAAGAFALLLGLAACLVRPGEGRQLGLIQPLAIAAVQLAFLVARADLGIEAWALYGALSAAALVLAFLRDEFRLAPAVGLALALLLLLAKAQSRLDPFVVEAAAGITLLYGIGAAVATLRRGGLIWTATASLGLAAPALIVRAIRPELAERPLWGLLLAALAIGPAFLVWANRRTASAEPPASLTLLVPGAAASWLAAAAVWDFVPPDLVAAGWLAVAIAAALASRRLGDLALATVTLVLAVAGVARALWMVPDLSLALLTSLFGEPVVAADLPGSMAALWALALPALLLAALRLVLPPLGGRRVLAPVAGLLGAAALYVWFKQAFGLGYGDDFVARAMIERTIVTQALFAAGWLLGSGAVRIPRVERDMVRIAGTMLTALAAGRLIWFDIVWFNPAFTAQWVGTLPVLNLILPAYLLSAVWLYAARRRAEAATRSGFWLIAFLAALIAGVALEVRQGFQGPLLDGAHTPIAEFYSYSLAGLVHAAGLIAAGMQLPDKALRLAGLVLLTATILKVFLVDASELEGVLRILSFLGLGIALIGIGRVYGPVLRAEREGA